MRDRIKQRAVSRVGYLIKKGILVRPGACSKCLKEGKVHGHHEDYFKMDEVVWLCPKCHVARHKELGRYWGDWRLKPKKAGGFIGVQRRSCGGYRGYITIDGKKHWTETFNGAEMAALRRDRMAIKAWGPKAILNWSNEDVSAEELAIRQSAMGMYEFLGKMYFR